MTDNRMAVPIHRRFFGRDVLFGLGVFAATLILGWLVLTRSPGFDNPATPYALIILLACTIGLMVWVGNPISSSDTSVLTHKTRLFLVILVVGALLFVLPLVFGAQVLYALPVAALLVLLVLRRPVSRREVGYALYLALAAAVAGLGAGWIHAFSPLAWAALQLPLVFLGLLCGWKILQHVRLAQQGVGRSLFLSSGLLPALRGLGLGMIMSLPWGLANIQLGGAGDTWVNQWWQPLVAIQPGIAEEAWGRMLMVPLLFLIFRPLAHPRTAFTVALLMAGYWFAYLHTEMGLAGLISTLMLGTLYALPISYLCLYRDLETAIGFHFAVDFVRFLAAYILFLI